MEALDEELMMKYKNSRDPEAMVELFRRHRRNLYRFLVSRTGSSSRAEDLAQEAFAALIEGTSRYQPTGSFKAYLYRIAANLSAKEWRTYRRTTSLPNEPAADAPDPEERAEASASSRTLQQALSALEPEQREAILLREYQDLSYTEIAEALSVPVGTIKSRIARGKLALRLALAL